MLTAVIWNPSVRSSTLLFVCLFVRFSTAAGDFKMTMHHKALAKKLMACAAKGASNEEMVKVALSKTKEIIGGLRKLADGNLLTTDLLAAKKLSAADSSFFFNVACAEGFANV